MATEKTDVVIIGVGAAGGILAAELGKAGMKVIGLERGPRLTTQDFNPHDELRYFQRQDLRPNIKRQPVTWRPNTDARANPMPVLNYGNQAGGGTVHYGAVSWRMHEDDFRARSHTIERYGASAIPADSSLADWPLSYADLEPFYDRAEYELGVSGKAGNLQGRKIDGGNVFEAPRRREYPLPPLLQDQAEILFDAAGRKLGYHPFSTPRAIISQPYQGRPGCTYCGFCQAFGCHVGAKSIDPRHQAAGGRCHRQFQAPHRSHLLSRQQRQQRPGDRRLLLGPRRLGQHDRGRSRHRDDVHLRQHSSAAAVEDGEIPQRPRQFERPAGQARDGAHDGRTCSSASTTGTSTSIWGRARRSIRSTTSTPTISTTRIWASSAARRSRSAPATCRAARSLDHHRHAARRAALGGGVSRLPRDILLSPRRHGGADREPALCRPDHRSRSEREGCLGPAGAARDLRLAAAQRARARRVHAEEDGGDRTRHGCAPGLAGAGQSGRRTGRASRGRHAHGERPEDLGGEPLRPELGYSEPLRHRQLDLPDA